MFKNLFKVSKEENEGKEINKKRQIESIGLKTKTLSAYFTNLRRGFLQARFEGKSFQLW